MKRMLVALMTMILVLMSTNTIYGKHSPGGAPGKSYVIAFKETGGLPDDYKRLVERSGGEVFRTIAPLGVVEAYSEDADFAVNIGKLSSVQAVNATGTVYPEKAVFRSEVMPSAIGSPQELYDAYQWDIKRVTNDGASWSLPNGTGRSVDGEQIVVAVIDTGIDYNHPDLKANYAYGKSFVPGHPDPGDEHGHGTHVAGMIAANGLVMGVGPDLKIASYRVFGPSGEAPSAQVAEAIVAAADDNVDVVNLSITGYAWLQTPDSAPEDMAAEAHMFNRAVEYASSQGATVVMAAGNSGPDVAKSQAATEQWSGQEADDATLLAPSNKSAIVVSATNDQDQLAFYSNYGNMVDVTAPGGDLGSAFLENMDDSKADLTKACFSTFPGGGYQWAIGTSQAVPKVSAIAGIIVARHGKDVLSPEEVARILEKSATTVGDGKQFGHGMVNAVHALNE